MISLFRPCTVQSLYSSASYLPFFCMFFIFLLILIDHSFLHFLTSYHSSFAFRRRPVSSFLLFLLIHSFIHSSYFYSAFSSPRLLRGAPDYSNDTMSELTRRSATGNCE